MLTGIREMEMREVPDPRISKSTDVLVRLSVVGVCGSDVHYYETGRIGSQVVNYPFTVGHESAGKVVEVGDAVTRVKPGDRIAIDPAMSCGNCDQCNCGRSNTCRHTAFLGCPGQAEGSLSDFILMPESSCFPLKDTTSFDEGSISEPLSIGVYSVKNSIPMTGARIGILGMGPIGMCVLYPALDAGVERVYCTDKVDDRLAIATRLGVNYAGNPDNQDVVADVLDREKTGLDTVFECCGQQDAIDQAIDLLKPGGKLMLIGIPVVDRIAFTIDKMRRKEICIQNVRRQEGCVQRALDLMEEKRVDVNPLVTHRFPFSDTKAAFDLVAAYRDGVMKAVIDFE